MKYIIQLILDYKWSLVWHLRNKQATTEYSQYFCLVTVNLKFKEPRDVLVFANTTVHNHNTSVFWFKASRNYYISRFCNVTITDKGHKLRCSDLPYRFFYTWPTIYNLCNYIKKCRPIF